MRGSARSRETECLAETVDRLTAVACQRAVDKIAQRFKSLEMVVSDRSWEIGATWNSYHHPTSHWRPARKNRIPRTTSNKRHRASPKSKGKGTFPLKEQPKLVAFHLHDTERCDLPRNSRLTNTFSLHRVHRSEACFPKPASSSSSSRDQTVHDEVCQRCSQLARQVLQGSA